MVNIDDYEQASRLASLDVSITWTPDENPRDVARRIVKECCKHNHKSKRIMDSYCKDEAFVVSLEGTLLESLHAYRDFCRAHMIGEQQRLVLMDNDDSKESCNNNDNNGNDCDCNCNGTSSTTTATTDIVRRSTTVLEYPKLKCRLVATRGHSGAKCPQFHIDNVPCRWIQTMVGPGVELVNTSTSTSTSTTCCKVPDTDGNSNADGDADGGEVIRWDAFHNYSPTTRSRSDNNNDGINDDENQNDDNDDILSWSVEDRNRILVDSSRADIYQSNPGEAVLIPGSSWDEYSLLSSSSSSTNININMIATTKPVVHKSPETLRSDQCRVLFTQDIIFE